LKIFKTIFFIISFCSGFVFSYENQNTFSLQTTGFFTKYASGSQYEHQLSLLSENHFQTTLNSQFKLSPLLTLEQESSETKTIYDLDAKEFIFNYSTTKNNIEIGYLNLKKEGPDIFDLWGYFQPKNYKSLLNINTLPALGISLESAISKNVLMTLAFVPQNRLSKIPSKNSMWLPRENKLPLASDDTVATLPDAPAYEIRRNESEKKQDLQNNYLVRLKYSGKQIDTIVQVAESISNTPIITPTLTGQLISINPTEIQLDNPILLDFKWKKNKNYGLGINYSFYDLGLITKIFSNYTVSPDDESVQTVLAFEKQFEDLIAVYEYTNTKKKNNTSGNDFAGTNSLFSNAHAMAFLYSVDDSVKIKVGGFLNTDIQSYAVLTSAKYQFNDSSNLELQYLAISAKKDSILSVYENNDSASIKLTTLF
jgi:hypothetical protein